MSMIPFSCTRLLLCLFVLFSFSLSSLIYKFFCFLLRSYFKKREKQKKIVDKPFINISLDSLTSSKFLLGEVKGWPV